MISLIKMNVLLLLELLFTAAVSGSIPSIEVVDRKTGGACQLVLVRYNFCEVVPPVESLLTNGWLLLAEWSDTHQQDKQWSYFSEVNPDTSPWCTNPFDKGNCGPGSNTFWGCDKKVHQTCVARLASTTSEDTKMGTFRSRMNPILNKDTNTISIPELYSVVSCVKNHFDNKREFYKCETHSYLREFYLFPPETFGEDVAFSLKEKTLVVLENDISRMAKKHCPDDKWCGISQSSTESLETFDRGTPFDRMNKNNTVVFFNAVKKHKSTTDSLETFEEETPSCSSEHKVFLLRKIGVFLSVALSPLLFLIYIRRRKSATSSYQVV